MNLRHIISIFSVKVTLVAQSTIIQGRTKLSIGLFGCLSLLPHIWHSGSQCTLQVFMLTVPSSASKMWGLLFMQSVLLLYSAVLRYNLIAGQWIYISEKNVSVEKWANTILGMWNRHINCKKQGVICLLCFERSLAGQVSCVLQQVPLFKKVVSLKASNDNNQMDRKFDLQGKKRKKIKFS